MYADNVRTNEQRDGRGQCPDKQVEKEMHADNVRTNKETDADNVRTKEQIDDVNSDV